MKIVRNIFRVAASNIVSIISGVLISFIIPKLLTVSGYGLYKIFTLYVSYLGLFSIGLIDGIVLKYGAKDYSELNKKEFRSYFKWYVIINCFWSLVFFIVGLILFQKAVDYTWIAIMLGIDLLVVNITGYFQQISQITQRFTEYSARKIIQAILNILIVGIFSVLVKGGIQSDYKTFLILTILINCLLTGWYIITYKSIVFGESCSLKETRYEVKTLILRGFPLLFANLCATLIMSLDRQFVSILFSTEEYAIYAFAYSMLSLVTVATSAVSTVLYPFLKRLDIEQFKRKYDELIVIVTACIFLLVSIYFPLCIVIEWFLPKYIASISIFRIIIPGIAISSSVTVIMHNYYKTLGLSADYFKKSILILLISAIANGFAYLWVGTMQSISIASVITMLIWYVYTNYKLQLLCGSKTIKNVLYIVIVMVDFYFSTIFSNHIVGLFIYTIFLFPISFAFYGKTIKKYIRLKKIA